MIEKLREVSELVDESNLYNTQQAMVNEDVKLILDAIDAMSNKQMIAMLLRDVEMLMDKEANGEIDKGLKVQMEMDAQAVSALASYYERKN